MTESARDPGPRIVVVDDSADDRMLVARDLRREFRGAEVVEVADRASLDLALDSSRTDLVITDYDLGWSNGLEVLRLVKERLPECPVILISGAIGDEFAVEAMKSGLSDYLIKDSRLLRLPAAVRSTLERSAEHRRAREAESQRLELFTNVPIGLYRTSPRGEILAANPAFAQILGYADPESLVGCSVGDLFVKHGADRDRLPHVTARMDGVQGFEMRLAREGGETFWVRNSLRASPGGPDRAPCYEGALQDVTAEKLAIEAILESEERYRRLVESSPVGIVVHVAGRIVFVNEAGVRMLGASDPAALLGRRFVDLVHPDFRAVVESDVCRCHEEGTVGSAIEERIVRLDGVVIDVEATSIPIVYAGAEAIQVVLDDVTERKRAREASAERSRLSELAAEVGRVLVQSGCLTATLQRCAGALVRHLDLVAARVWLVDRGSDRLVPSASAGDPCEPDEWAAGGPPGRHGANRVASERRILHGGGADPVDPREGESMRRAGLVASIGYPLAVGDRTFGVMEVFSRHSLGEAALEALDAVAHSVALGIERHGKEEELTAALRRAEESDRLKGTFLGNVSHEIRTPLNIIIGYNDLLQDCLGSRIDASEVDVFRAIRNASHRLLTTVTGILDLSRLETQTLECHPEPLALKNVVEAQIEILRPEADRKGLALSFDCEVPDATVQFDEYCLSKSIFNLLDNAIKFTPGGGVEIRLHATAEGGLALAIRDTGVGIEPDFHASLFHPFTQEQDGLSRGFEGPGIGLALTKMFLELNGARIDLESEKGRGATFTISFARPGGGATPEARPPDVRTAGRPEAGDRPRPTVLIVEDDADTQTYMRVVLSRSYEVLSAETSAEARRRLETASPAIDVILMDISLGGSEDGIELTRWLRKRPEWRAVPVIVVTAHALASDRRRAAEAGCDDYLTKPFERDDLLRLMDRWISTGRRAA